MPSKIQFLFGNNTVPPLRQNAQTGLEPGILQHPPERSFRGAEKVMVRGHMAPGEGIAALPVR